MRPVKTVSNGSAGDVRRRLPLGSGLSFGENWRRFLSVVNDARIAEAERSLRSMLGVESLRGRTFLDIGCGSGLFSLAAARRGAERVQSLDFDIASVACTQELRRRFGGDAALTIERGSVLDDKYVAGLRKWDVVYSWGVLDHTGDMRRALANAARPVNDDGLLFVSIYNDQGARSRIWRRLKRLYNALPPACASRICRRRHGSPRVPLFRLRDRAAAPLGLRSLMDAVPPQPRDEPLA